MSPVELFIALVFLAFVGGLRARREQSSGFLAGVEFVLLGVAVGPRLLGLVSTSAFHPFEPLLLMALGWLLTVRGANFAATSGTRLRFLDLFLPTIATVFCSGLVFYSVRYLALRWNFDSPNMLALGAAVVTAETASIFGERAPPGGQCPPDLNLLHRLSASTELVPVLILVTMMLFSVGVMGGALPGYAWLVVSVLLGLLSGGIVVALIGAHFEEGELWPLLLGSVLLVVGTALRLSLPALTPCFLLGLAIAILSPHRRKIRELLNGTHRQLLLPCLLLTGAMFDWPDRLSHWLIVLAAVGARAAAKLVIGGIVSIADGRGFKGALLSGCTLFRASGFSIILGLSIFLDHSDASSVSALGKIVLTTAIVSTVIGELVGTFGFGLMTAQSKKSEPEPESEVLA